MYQRHHERRGGFGKGMVVFSITLVGLLVIGLGMAGVFGGGDDRSIAEEVPPADLGPSVSDMTTAEPVTVEEPTVRVTPVAEALPEAEFREVTYGEAEAVYLDRRYSEALDLFTIYTEQHPENPWGFYMYALSAWKSGENESAETGFQTALGLDPNHVKSYLNLARVLLEENRPQEALEQGQKAQEVDPNRGETFRILGRAYHNLGKNELAIEAYLTATTLDDGDAWAANNMGLVLIQEGRFEEALSPLARAAELDPEKVVFHNNLGIALERTGHFALATRVFQAALDLDDTNDKVLVNLERVSALNEDPGLTPVDLAQLAREFKNGPVSDPLVETTTASKIQTDPITEGEN